MFERGERIEFSYPVNNTVEATQIAFRRRHIEVVKTRDLVSSPLTPVEFLRRPFVRRSRWLLTGVEVETGQWRNFYVGASREFRAPGTLRIGLYQPEERRPRKILTRGFGDSTAERRKLIRLLYLLSKELTEQSDLEIKILADDLRLIS